MIGGSRWPLVGREAAVDSIRALLADDQPRSVVIAGSAGLGRTRLLREAMSLAVQFGRPVRWAAATEPAALIPLGPLAHLVPAVEGPADPLALVQRAAQAVAGDRADAPTVVCVDDVHLLDPLSVTLLYQLAAGGSASLVLTVRTDNAAPDPTAPLWKDDLAARIELSPLGLADTARLMSTGLGGVVESRTVQRVWQLTGGNPLFLREIVDDGLRTGSLSREDGLWRQSGPVTPSQRLSEIVLRELGTLEPAERSVLELLAALDSLDVRQLTLLSDVGGLTALERRGLLVDDTPRAGRLRLTHPMIAAVVRNRMSEASVLMAGRRLVEDAGDVVGEDPVGQQVRRFDAGLPVTDGDAVTEAASSALRGHDVHRAESLAQAGWAAGGGARAARVLAEALRWQGRSDESDRVAREASASTPDQEERSRLAVLRAMTLSCGLDRSDEAAEALEEVRRNSPDCQSLIATAGAALALLRGDVPSAVRTAKGVLTSLPPSSPVRPLATAVAALGLAVSGCTTEALAVGYSGRASLERSEDVVEPLFADVALAQAEVIALHLAGRIPVLERRAAEHMRENLAQPQWAGDAVASLHRGCAALAAGRPNHAVRWLREARAGLDRLDPLGVSAWASALLRMALALLGESDDEATSLHAHDRKPGAVALYEPFTGLAAACSAASAGRAGDTGGLIREAAALAAGQGQAGVQALVLHRAVKAGMAADVAPQLDQLARALDAPFLRTLARHAAASAAGDGKLLREVSAEFLGAGAVLLAAEAAAEAAAAFEQTGAGRAAADCRAMAVAHYHVCGITAAPALDGSSLPALTSREKEVATLAGRGMSNQAIAEHLVLSVRTVEAHLAHAYTKLGVNGRADLTALLRSGTDAEPDGAALSAVGL